MAVDTSLASLSQTAANNGPDGTTDAPSALDDALQYHGSFIAMLRDGQGFSSPVTLASASTTDIGGQAAMAVEITGTTTVTSFGTNYNGPRLLRFTGALTLTHNSTSLNLPGSANITTAAGDTCTAIPNSSGNGWNVVQYQRANFGPGSNPALGYHKLPNGLILQWGNTSSAGSGSQVTITFPIAFTTSVMAALATASGGTSTQVSVWRDSVSLTQYVIRSDAGAGSAIFWFAIGY